MNARPTFVDVWLDGWQVHEEHLEVSLHEHVTWNTIPMDQAWVALVFGEAQTIPRQRDTYAHLTHEPDDPAWETIIGRVHRILVITLSYGTSVDPAKPELVPLPASVALRPTTALTDGPSNHPRAAGFIITVSTDHPKPRPFRRWSGRKP